MEKLTYEQAIKRLEHIISILESNDVPLEESIELFQEGVKLSHYCDNKLQSIQQKVAQIYENGEIREFHIED